VQDEQQKTNDTCTTREGPYTKVFESLWVRVKVFETSKELFHLHRYSHTTNNPTKYDNREVVHEEYLKNEAEMNWERTNSRVRGANDQQNQLFRSDTLRNAK
jgi:hypothetical protein